MKQTTPAPKNQSKSPRSIAALAMIGILTASSPAATYFVAPKGSDSNPGTMAKPFASLYRATSKTVPGDVVYLRGGTYKYSASQTVQGTGSAAARLNVLSYPGERAILDFSAAPAGKNGLQVAGKYVNVSNVTVQNAPGSNISVWGSTYVSVKNVKSTGSYAAGILVGGTTVGASHHVEISGSEVTGCVKVNAKLNAKNWQPAIQIYQGGNVTVSNNSVHENYGEGIGFCTATDSLIQGNTVWDNFSVNVYLDNVDNVDVTSNFVYNTGNSKFYRGGRGASGVSMCVEGVSNPIGLRNSEVSKNTIVNCFAGIWYSSYGLGGGLKNFRITNNTIYKTTGGALLWIDSDKGHLGNIVSGNVFQQSGTAVLSNLASTAGLGLGNNCWYGGKTGLGAQSSDLLKDPMLLRPGSYKLADYTLNQLSPCLAKGIGATASASAQTKI